MRYLLNLLINALIVGGGMAAIDALSDGIYWWVRPIGWIVFLVAVVIFSWIGPLTPVRVR